jgi:hypothetical protein
MKKLFILKSMLVTAGIIALLVGCAVEQNPGSGDGVDKGIGSGETGILFLTISPGDFEVQMIQPTLDMTIASYEANGMGPGGATFGPLTVPISGSLQVQLSLEPGDWDVTVDAKNADIPATTIGTKTETVTLVPGGVVGAIIVVEPVSGSGNIDLVVSWPQAAGSNFRVEGELDPADPLLPTIGMDFLDPPFSVGTEFGTNLINTAHQNGYYKAIVKLYDTQGTPAVTTDDIFVWGTVEAARVIFSETASRQYSLVQELNGTLTFDIIPDLQNPIEIAIEFDGTVLTPDPIDGSLPVQTVTFGTPSLVVAATYTDENGVSINAADLDMQEWYHRADEILAANDSNTVTLGSQGMNELAVGTHWLDLLIQKGPVLSSQRVIYVVQ